MDVDSCQSYYGVSCLLQHQWLQYPSRAGLKANRASTVLLELQGGADVARANSIPCNTVLDLFYRSFLGYICIDMSTHLVAPLRDYSPGLVGVEVTGIVSF